MRNRFDNLISLIIYGLAYFIILLFNLQDFVASVLIDLQANKFKNYYKSLAIILYYTC